MGGERLDAISAALARLVREQDEQNRRIERIEQALGLASEPRVAPPSPESMPAPHPASPVPMAEGAKVEPPRFDAAPSRQVGEATFGLTWLNRIGVVTLLLALGFFFKLAVENQWIGPRGRIVLGCLAGIAALGIAHLLWKRGHTLYSHGLTGLGIGLLYL